MRDWHIRTPRPEPSPAAKATPAELALWQQMAHGKLGAYFKRRQPIGTFCADFLCRELNLVIELEGGCDKAWRESDRRRTRWMRAQGYTVLRFAIYDVHRNLEGVALAIGDEILRLRR